MPVKPIPDGYRTVTPLLVAEKASELIDFLRDGLGATELHRMTTPEGRVMHAEYKIGDSIVMMGEACGESKAMPTTLYLYVEDVDTVYQRALQAGATSSMELADQFWGDRCGDVVDPAGNHWMIATHVEDVSPEEMRRRSEEFIQQHSQEPASAGSGKPE